MRLSRLVWRNVAGNAFRSGAVLLCAALVAGLVLTATFVVRGAEAGLRDNLERLGADMLVLPWGTMTDRIGGVRLMSAAIDRWMPRANLARLAAIEGVAQVSPQWYLATLKGPEYSVRPEAYLVAYDPATDVVLRPWLVEALPEGVSAGQVVVGADIRVPPDGEPLTLFGSDLEVAGRLTATATSIDQTIFVTFQAAEEMVARSRERGDGLLKAMPGSISAIMLKAELDADPHEVAILLSLPKALVSTGKLLPITFSNNSAFPPPGTLDMRSVISVISSSGDTGPTTLFSSPSFSRRFTKLCRSL